MKKLFTLAIAISVSAILPSMAQMIPDSCMADWSKAGYTGNCSFSDTTVNIMDFGAQGNGQVNDAPALSAAIASLGGRPGTIFLPPGTYRFDSGISIPDSTRIMGAGSDSSKVLLNHSGSGFAAAGNAATTFFSVSAGLKRMSNCIICTGITGITAGDFIELRQDNGSWDTQPASWAEYSVGQILKVIAVNTDTLYVDDALRIDFDTLLNPSVRKIYPVFETAVECIGIERTDNSTTATGYNILFSLAVNGYVKGTESNYSQGSHCMINLSRNITISGCYFHDAFLYDGSGTKGYGVTLNNHACMCLVENNIFKHLRHAMMTKHGANGNVFAYNYSTDPYRNGQFEIPQDYCGDISLHGHFSFANLFEGNIVQTIYIDEYWGPSGPYNTFFRNRAALYGIIMTSPLTNNQNFVGNEITGTGYTFPFNHGAYTITGNDHFEYGNNRNGTLIPAGSNNLTDSSCYKNFAPVYWPQYYSWPSVGMPVTLNSGTIPAQERYISGHYTDCSAYSVVTYKNPDTHYKLSLYPQPAIDNLTLTVLPEISGNLTLSLYDLKGRKINAFNFAGTDDASIPLYGLAPGIYIITVSGDSFVISEKITIAGGTR